MNVLGLIIMWLLIAAVAILLGGFVWMVALGVVADVFKVPNLAVGYWDSIKAMFAFGFMFGGFSVFNRNKSN